MPTGVAPTDYFETQVEFDGVTLRRSLCSWWGYSSPGALPEMQAVQHTWTLNCQHQPVPAEARTLLAVVLAARGGV